jgi:predicted ATPase
MSSRLPPPPVPRPDPSGKPIDCLTIRGFKSIRSLQDLELSSLNVLIGPNGAGKSNFIDFFRFLRSLVNQELQLAVNQYGGADRLLFLGPKVTSQIGGKLVFGKNSYEFGLVPTVDDRLVFDHELVAFAPWDTRKAFSKGLSESTLKDLAGKKPSASSHVYASVASWTVYHFHDTSDTSPVRRRGTVRDHERLRHDGSNLAAFLLELRAADEETYSRVRELVRSVAPFFDDFRLRVQTTSNGDDLTQLEWTQRGSDYPFHPSQFSDGTLRFTCMATALLQPSPPPTILLDEPELGLHPHSLSILAGLIRQASQQTQVIVSTQSATLLDEFEPENVIVVDRDLEESSFRRLSRSELTEWLQQYSLGELWRKNVFEGGPSYA